MVTAKLIRTQTCLKAVVRERDVASAWYFYATVLILLLISRPVSAALEASVDRTEITENESVQLTISTALNVSSSLSLFNLNTLSIPQPDVTALEKDFEILDRQQSYRVQIDNNQNNSVINWTYTLVPRSNGDITIPAIEYEGEKSAPIALRVRETTAKSTQDREVFVEAETDLEEIYVQQQLIYTVRLYYSLDLISGELEHPNHQQATFTQIGKQKEFSRHVGSKRFSVIERTYAVFPKSSGELTLPPVNFSGTFIKRRIGKRVYHKGATEPVTIKVKPPPESFTGNLWLPAQSLSIRDVWSDPAREINVGDSLTRTIQVLALGLEGVQLPPLPKVRIGGLKVYPEPGKTTTEEHAAGVTGSREEVQALIATTPGSFTLPEIRIPWWDVDKDEERVAILRGRVITVLGEPGNADAGGKGLANSPPSLQIPDNVSGENPASEPLVSSQQAMGNSNHLFWKLTTVILGLLWLTTLYILWRRPATAGRQETVTTDASEALLSLEHLQQLAAQGSPDFAHRFSLWLMKIQRSGDISSRMAARITELTRADFKKLQSSLYGPGQFKSFDAELAKQIVDKVKNLLAQQKQQSESSLPAFYPTTQPVPEKR